MTAVTVKFSKPVDPVTALNPAHYSINGGALAVTGVQWASSANANVVNTAVYDAIPSLRGCKPTISLTA